MKRTVPPMAREEVIWRPQPGPQTAFVNCPVEEIFYGGARAGGKLQPNDSLVLTPFGWRKIGSLVPGQRICATDSTTTDVIATYPQGVVDIYKVHFSDGAVVEAGLDHNWLAWRCNKQVKKGNKKVCGKNAAQKMTTREIMQWLRTSRKRAAYGTNRVAIPVCEPVCFNVASRYPKREIDPYILGLLLGDGYIKLRNAVRLTSADVDIANAFIRYLGADNVRIDRREGNAASEYAARGAPAAVLWNRLVKMGLAGKGSENKFIPRAYLFADIPTRWALLQGLMDTDGWAEQDGEAYYCTISPQLADDVMHLARSLGAIVSRTEQVPTYTYKGERHDGQLAYKLRLKFRANASAFRLARKIDRCKDKVPQTHCRYIERVEFSRKAEAVCIEVRHANSLYITDDFVVTHNTDASIGRALIRALKYQKHFKGHFIRRELTQLEPVIARSKEIYSSFGTYNESKKIWTFNSGGSLHFRYIERDADADKFLGDSCTDLLVEEIGNFPDIKPLLKLKGILRSVAGVPPSFCATGNPGGVGASLIKRRYVDPAPEGWRIIKDVDELTGLVSERIYIPSRITDNQLLLRNDPGYLSRLTRTGSAALVRSWLEGDFSAIEGAFFEKFNPSLHVVRNTKLPEHWLRFRAMDWGSWFPFYICWCAHASEDFNHPDGPFIPKGSIVVYREWYGSAGHNNTGLKMPAPEVGLEIQRIERGMKIKPTYGVLDPSAFKMDGGPSVAERIARATDGAVTFRRADNRRIGKDGAMGGWDALRERINGIATVVGDRTVNIPTLYIFEQCADLIRTLPMMQHDKDNPEDLMGAEDHPSDSVRYAIMSRPWLEDAPKPKAPFKDFRDMTLNELWVDHEKTRGRHQEWRI